MTTPHSQVRFLQIGQPEDPNISPTEAKEAQVIALAEACLAAQKSALILVSPQRIHALDELLWSAVPESFLPHGILPCELEGLSLFLAHRACEIEGIDTLIVAAPMAPIDWMARFPEVIDFVESHDLHLREQSRKRFKEWRARGATPVFEK